MKFGKVKRSYQKKLNTNENTSLPPLCLRDSCRRLKGHKGRCDVCTMEPLKNLPEEVVKKIGKTSMTRGAQPYDRVPYQNRVRRWNRAVIPFKFKLASPVGGYENGYTIMVRPEEYFNPDTLQRKDDFPGDVIIGENAFIYYDNRKDWNDYPPEKYNWEPCYILLDEERVKKRVAGVVDKGHFVARVPATTTPGAEGEKIVKGIPQGIRFFEHASREETWKTMMQLAYLAWKSEDIGEYSTGDMPRHLESILEHYKLNDDKKLESNGSLRNGVTCCPLCRESVKALDLIEKVAQVPGREVVDLTITKASLFHLDALTPGKFTHKVYRVAWGHYHCNVVIRDKGVDETLSWMEKVLVNTGRIKQAIILRKRKK